MTWKTVLLIVSLICLGAFALGVQKVLGVSTLGAGLFFFVATFISIQASTPKA